MRKTPFKAPTMPALAALALAGALSLAGAPSPESAEVSSYIVQTSDVDPAAAVRAVGGRVTHELAVIHAAAAELTLEQAAELRRQQGVRQVWSNGTAELTGKSADKDRSAGSSSGGGSSMVVETFYTSHLGADQLHAEGIDGTGVTIAVLDSGIFSDNGLKKDPNLENRVLMQYNAVLDLLEGEQHPSTTFPQDDHGHGSHVTSIAISSRQTSTGSFNGMAPDADLVVVKAFDASGQATYADVIRGIDWVVANKDVYGIRVLNCSFSAEPQSYYWDDPLNQAVMAAWQMGIVVVASAGNRGPDPMTIGAPGNVPYIITVGAMTDSYTPENYEDDLLASFSSTGPTVEAFVKPDLVAPGGHVLGLMKNTAQIAQDHPEFHDGGYYFNMSGTSQATAFVTGTVALMLEANPGLTPDEVKYRLMATANRASFSGGSPTYSVFQQGAGRVDAYGAVHATETGSANRGMDIGLDLLGLRHYRGPADAYLGNGPNASYTYFIRDSNGNPIEDDGYLWDGKYVYQDGFIWSDAFIWSDTFIWSDGFIWNDAFIWSDAVVFDDAFIWSDLATEALFTESWVPQE